MALCVLFPWAAQANGTLPVADISAEVTPIVVGQQIDLDRITRQRTSVLDVVVTNRSARACLAPLHLVIDLSQGGVVVTDATAGPAEPPYFAYLVDLSPLLANGLLPVSGSLTCQVVLVSNIDVFYSYGLRTFAHLNESPLVDEGGPYAAIFGEGIEFDASGTTDPEGQAMTYAWDFGDGEAATGPIAPHTYARVGTYQVVLTVSDELGGQTIRVLSVPVLPSETFALARTRSLSPVGHPLGGVIVTEFGPSGERAVRTDAATGFTTLGETAGDYRWRFTAEGHLPASRWGTLHGGEVAVIPTPWLAARNPVATEVSPLREVRVLDETGAQSITFPAGAIGQFGEATLTQLGGQTLPGPLPVGWSPLCAFSLELPAAPVLPGTALLALAGRTQAGETVALARWDESAWRWDVVELVTGTGGTSATVPVASAGAHALVVADGGVLAPPAPAVGQPLPAGPAGLPDAETLTAEGRVEPNPAVASLDPGAVTATATVTFFSTNPVPSGLVLRCDVEESYLLNDGSTRKTPDYETFITAYQRPGDVDPTTLHAAFPLRPRLLLGADELNEARIRVAVLPAAAFHGAIVNQQGGVASGDGVQIGIDAGTLSGPGAVEVRRLPLGGFTSLAGLPADAVVLAFELNAPDLSPGSRLTPAFDVQAPNAWFVLARVVFGDGQSGLEPVERFASDAEGRLQSREPADGDRLPGITGAGQYVLIRVDGPQALLTGTARSADGTAAGGLVVTVQGLPWLTLSGPDGVYRLVAPVGEATVRVHELSTGNQGSTIATVLDPDQPTVADVSAAITGPWVVAVDPADGATGVRRATAVTVRFSEPVNPAGFADLGILLVDSNAQPVVGSLSLSQDGRAGSFLPGDVLEADTLYTIVVSPALADLSGLPIEGVLAFQFTTAAEAARGTGAELVIYEPGSTNCPAIGSVPGYVPGDTRFVCVAGSQGTADPGVPIILVNYGSGETATVLSKSDGSFVSIIRAVEEDLISAVFINGNGTRIEVPAGRQLFDDGRVGLFAEGGVLEVEGPDGPLQILVHPGTVAHRNVFRMEPLTLAEVLQDVTNSPPDQGQVVAGFAVSAQGDIMDGPSDVSLPFDPAVLGLPPGENPEDGAFALTVVREVDGGKAYQVVDKLKYEQGRLRSNTFTGLLASLGANTLASAGELTASVVFLGSKPLVINGRTWEYLGSADPERGGALRAIGAGELQEAASRPLPGALVVLHLVEQVVTARPGRIRAGAFYSSSDQDGRFSLVAPVSGGQYVVSGTHTRFADYPTTSISMSADLAFGTVQRDLYFSTPLSASAAPRVDVSHVPQYPRPGETCELRATASGTTGAPTVSLAVVGSPGVTLSNQTSTALGFQRTRFTANVTAAFETTAQLELTATESGRTLTVPYRIQFTFQPPEHTGPGLTPSDPDDAVGPKVVRSVPSQRGSLSLGEPIRLVFDEAISANVTNLAADFVVSPGGITPTEIRISADQSRIELSLPDLPADTSCTLTVPSSVEDLNGNALGDSPDGTGPTAYVLEFLSPRTQRGDLGGVVSGGGAVTRGAYAYALDRGEPGGVRVYDVSIPSTPVEAATLSFGAGYPRDLAFIPRWSYAPSPTQPAVTRDLLAVVGGKIGATQLGDEGYVLSYGQTLSIYNVSDPPRATRVANLRVTLQQNAVTKVMWSPPQLAYLEIGADLQQVAVIDLQEMLVGLAAPDAMPSSPRAGVDLNGDGDYTDPGETIPLPPRRPAEFFGKKYALALEPGDHRQIRDFHFERGYCGMVLEGAPSVYRTFLYNGLFLPSSSGAYPFPAGATPRRLTALFQVELAGAGGPTDLALVTLSVPEGSGRLYQLAVLDITDPSAPTLLAMIPFPDQPSLAGLYPREDGLVAMSTGSDLILLDPTRLAEPSTASGTGHPAVVGIVPGVGSVSMTFDPGNPAGVYVANHGGKHQVLQTAPSLRFVSFPSWPSIVDPLSIPGDPGRVATLLQAAVSRTALPPARFRDLGGVASTLNPADPAVHYHVLVDAPGGAGTTIQLAAESLTGHGRALPNRGAGFAATRAMSVSALGAIGQLPGIHDAPIQPLLARRLSDDMTSAAYNLYLSQPIALTYERMSKDDLDSLNTALPIGRKILWSTGLLRASFDPALQLDPLASLVLGPYLSTVRTNRLALVPGASVAPETLPAPYVMGPNPPPLGGSATLPYTFGLVSAHNAEFRHTTTDIALPSRQMGIALERTIGGQDLYYGPFGRGWDMNYSQHLRPLAWPVFAPGQKMPLVIRSGAAESAIAQWGDVLFHTGYGRLILFRDAGAACPPEAVNDPLVKDLGWDNSADRFYLPEPGVFDLLFRFPDGRFVRLTPDGTRFWYRPSGTLDKVVNRYTKNLHRLSYNDHGELVGITDDAVKQRYVRLGYWRLAGDSAFDSQVDTVTPDVERAGLVARLRDSSGTAQRDILYRYSYDGRLEIRQDVLLSGANGGFSGRPETEYLWDTTGGGDIAGLRITQGAGGALFAATLGGPPGQRVVTGASAAGAAISVTPPPANTAATMDGSRTVVNGPYAASRTYTFDPWARPVEIQAHGSGAGDAINKMTYSADGLLSRRVYPEGDAASNTYSTASQSLRSRANLTRIDRLPIPGRGGVAISATYPYDADSRYNLLSGTGQDFNGKSVTYHTGSEKDVQSVDFDQAGSLARTYNDYGQVDYSTTPEGAVFDPTYDPDWGDPVSIKRGANETTFTYDRGSPAGMLGRPETIRPPRGTATTGMTYDNRLMLTSATRGGFWVRRGYDANGNQAVLQHAVGLGQEYRETREYTQLDVPLRSTVEDVPVEGLPVSLTTVFTPDANAPWRLTSVTYPGSAPRQVEEYDHLERVKRIRVGSYVEEYERDLNGNLLRVSQGGATTAVYTPDGHNRVASLVRMTGSPAEDPTQAFTYHPAGDLKSVSITDPTYGPAYGMEASTVDGLGRARDVTRVGSAASPSYSMSYDDGARSLQVDGPLGYTMTTVHDTAGFPSQMTTPLSDVAFTVDGNGNITGISANESGESYQHAFGFDDLDHLKTYGDGLGQRLQLDPRADGLPTNVTDARGQSTAWDWSVLGEPLSQTRGTGGAAVEFGYEYKDNRLVSAVNDSAGPGLSFSYDAEQRLESVRLRDGVTQVGFGGYDARNHPTRIDIPAGTMNAGYDLQGRVTSMNVAYAAGGTHGTNYVADYTYDGLDRVRRVGLDQGDEVRYEYDPMGPLTSLVYRVNTFEYVLDNSLRGDGLRSRLTYPSGIELTIDREGASGRFTGIRVGGADPIYEVTQYRGIGVRSRVSIGGGVIRESNEYDSRKRLLARRYERADGTLLLDVRYGYASGSNDTLVARQSIHRGGRADLFGYDEAGRLTAAEIDARPTVPEAAPRSLPGYRRPTQPGFHAGRYARGYDYSADRLDKRTRANTYNPDGLPVPPFAATLSDFDAWLHPATADGFDRGPTDPWGNTARLMLQVHEPGTATPQPTPADVFHNGLSQLVEVQREDGVKITYTHLPNGLCYERKVDAPAPSDRVWVYDDALLIEEYERTGGGSGDLVARYYYAQGDVPVAADLKQADGLLHRYYYLRGIDGSILAVADDNGQVVERVHYDPWGQPAIELPDTRPPHIAWVKPDTNGLLICFSETVLPPLVSSAAGSTLITMTHSLTGAVTLTGPSGVISNRVVYRESVPGAGYGSVLAVVPEGTLPTDFTLTVRAGSVLDEWDNPNPAESLPLSFTTLVNGEFYRAAITNTATERLTRSPIGNPFLFHGQYFDYDAGLVYLRARFYDPYTGLFLEQDPQMYGDSVNQYAAFQWDPVGNRDPAGRNADSERSVVTYELIVDDPLLPIKEGFMEGALEGTAPEYMSFYVRQEMQQDTIDKVMSTAVGLLAPTGADKLKHYYEVYEAHWKPVYDETGFLGYAGEPDVRKVGITQEDPNLTVGDLALAVLDAASLASPLAAPGSGRLFLPGASPGAGATSGKLVGEVTRSQVKAMATAQEQRILKHYVTELNRIERMGQATGNALARQNTGIQMLNEIERVFGSSAGKHLSGMSSPQKGIVPIGSAFERETARRLLGNKINEIRDMATILEGAGYY